MIKELIHREFQIKDDDNMPFTPLVNCGRHDLFKLMGLAGFKVGAEIGVWNGVHARSLFGLIPGLKLYCVDPWAGYNQEHYFTDEEMGNVYADAKQNLQSVNAELLRMTSLEAANLVANGLDFVYIDACHYFDEVMLDIIKWAPKVRPGGIVAGHDFKELYKCGVIEAVYNYVNAHKIKEWYTTFEEIPSWFWIAE